MSIIIKGGSTSDLADVTSDKKLAVAADTQVYNGATSDKVRAANTAAGTAGTGVPAAGLLGYDGANWQRLRVDTGGVQIGSTYITSPSALANSQYAMVNIFGAQSVVQEPMVRFDDEIDGTGIDTINRWAVGGTVVPTQPAGGSLLINTGTAANSSSSLSSQATFHDATFNIFVAYVTLEAAPIATGNHRFWGMGLAPGTWTAANPLQEGFGFEVTTTGQLRAVVYSAGAVVYAQNLTIPTDGLQHQYYIQWRPGMIFFYVDSYEVPCPIPPAMVMPSISALPLRLHSINGASTTTATPLLSTRALALLDMARSATSISDGTYPWRRAKIDGNGNLAVAHRATDQVVTATASSGVGVTLTLPAPGASLYHYITCIHISKYATTNLLAGATPTVVSSTNLPGGLAWTLATAGGAGAMCDRIHEEYGQAPLKVSAANTATTITVPSQAGVIVRVTVNYYIAP